MDGREDVGQTSAVGGGRPGPADADERLAPAPSRSASFISLFAVLVAVVAAGLYGWVLVVQVREVPWLDWVMAPRYVIAVLLLAGELRPLLLARADGGTDGVTVSTTFALALVVAGPLSLAMTVQAAAVAADDVRQRRDPLKTAFNVGQYVITLAAARATYCLLTGRAYADPLGDLHPSDLWAVLVAGMVFFVVNNGAVAVVVAMALGQNALRILADDVRAQLLTSGILIGLAPVTVIAAQFSIFALPLLVLPLVGVQHHAWMATMRQHEALHDGLTGLPNRALFRLRADAAIRAAARDSRQTAAAMLLDLDHFKEVNDTLGHHVGDGLLIEVARRVTDSVPPTVTVARLGGDEFAVLVPATTSTDAVITLAERIAARLREPVVAEGVRLSVQASIGVAFSADHEATTDTLLQRADIALYRAKENRGETQVYRPEIDQHTVHRLSLIGDLHSAADNAEFTLAYQPQVDTRTGRVVAVEALMRWNHPAHGVVPPDVFIPLAENTGLIRTMSRSAIQASLEALTVLRRAEPDLTMAVNFSARLLSDLELASWVDSVMRAAGVPPEALTVEVTESSIMADPTRAAQVLDELRGVGVRLSIDDFGTGYSSLSYLRRLRPDELKVDKSFVLHMADDENSQVIVRSTIDLGHSLGMSVVAEGVEDESRFAALTALDCDRAQGFHIARPMTADVLEPWLEIAAAQGWRVAAGLPPAGDPDPGAVAFGGTARSGRIGTVPAPRRARTPRQARP